MDQLFDIAVIGGGVVGCTTISELTNCGYRCVLLEKNENLVSEASSGNSGMLHTGFDAYEGHEMDCIRYTQGRVFDLLDKLGVSVKKTGATMVVWKDQQILDNCLIQHRNINLERRCIRQENWRNYGCLYEPTAFVANEGHEMDCIQYTQKRVSELLEKLGVPVKKTGATMVAWNDQQERVFELLQKLAVPVKKTGATMVAWTDQQKEQLTPILDKCRRNNVTSLDELSSSQVHQREPHLKGVCKGGLWIPGEAVTDSWLFPVLMANDARKKGANIRLNCRVQSCTFEPGVAKAWSLETTTGNVRARAVVNCAGLYGDKVDMLAGIQNFKIKPRKGQYLVYASSARPLINSSILPVPTSRGKGIIVFKSVYDNVVVGPTAEDVTERTRAPIDDNLTKRLYNVSNDLITNLNKHNTVCMYTGVRPATEVKDYIFGSDSKRNWITVGGIRSTGLSGCLGIAFRVLVLVQNDLCIEPTRGRSATFERPEVRYWQHGVVSVDGLEHTITHPLSYLGFKQFTNRL